MTRTERICIAIRMLAQEPGWISLASYVEATGVRRVNARFDIHLIRAHVELEEHRSGRHRAWTLPGARRPPFPTPPRRVPRRRQRKPEPSRATGIRARQLDQGLRAYQLAADGQSWEQAAVATGYGSPKAAWAGARRAARRLGLVWPLKYVARVDR